MAIGGTDRGYGQSAKHSLFMKKTFKLATLLFPVLLGQAASGQWVINELHADPASDISGDDNGDGTRNGSQDEFIELVNMTGGDVDIENWTINDGFGLRHTFVGSTVVADGQAVVVFGGGTPTGTFGNSVVQVASEGLVGLNNGGDTVTVFDESLTQVVSVTYGSEGGNNESLVRDPDLTGVTFVGHSLAAGSDGALFSPGTQIGGSPFGGDSLSVSVDPSSFLESAGASAATGTVTRTGDLTASLTVTLSSSDLTELTVPATVEIPAAAASADFDIDAVDDADQDADQSVQITASGPNLFTGSATVTVSDDEAPIPTIEIAAFPTALSENGGSSAVTVTISDASPSGYTFDVGVDDSSEASAPATVSIAPNATSGTFTITGVDDVLSDGSQTVTVTVSDPGAIILERNLTLIVTDDEAPELPTIVINEIRTDDVGADDDEYVELYSAEADFNLTDVWLIVLGDFGAGDTSGNVDRAYSLNGSSATGNYFVIGSDNMLLATPDYPAGTNIFENGDSLTFLLVTGFTGATGVDLDVDNDGTLDSTPWVSLLDAVSLVEPGDAPGAVGFGYAESLGFTNVLSANGFVPAYAYRNPNGTGDLIAGPFGDDVTPAIDSPGAENSDGGIEPPGPVNVELVGFTMDGTSGSLTVTGLGADIYVVESSTDLGQSDAWAPLVSPASEVDNPDGSVSFNFVDPEAVGETKIFYRVAEAP